MGQTLSPPAGQTTAFENADFTTTGLIGINFAERTNEPRVRLGTVVASATRNSKALYIKAGAAIAAGGTCDVDQATFVTKSGATYSAENAPFAKGEYGFVIAVAGAV